MNRLNIRNLAACRNWVVILALVSAPGCGWNPFGTREEYLRRGRQFVEQGKYDDAALQFRKALQKDDKYGEAYLRFGQLLERQGKTAAAFSALARAVDLMPDSEEAQVALGRIAITALLGDLHRPEIFYKTADKMATQLLARNQNSFEGLRLKGYLAVADKHTKETIDYFQRALQAKPNQPDVVTVLAQTLLLDNQGPEAERIAKNALGSLKIYGPLYDTLYSYYMASHRTSDGEQLLKSKISSNPQEAFFVIELADHYWGQKQTKEAEDLLRAFVANTKQYPTARLEAGDFYRRVGKLDEALALYQQGLESNRDRRKDYLQRIVGVRLEQDRIPEATAALETVLKEYPNDPEAGASRAELRMATGKPEEMRKAVAEFNNLLKQTPNNNEIRYSLGRAYRQIGQDSDARACFQEILRRDPKHRKALREMADLEIRDQKPDEALQYAERLLELDPNNVGARLVRTSAWALRGRFSEVRGELRRLTAEHPNLVEAWLQTATLNLDEKHYAEAERIFHNLSLSARNDIRPLKGLVAVYLAQGQPGRAVALVRQEAKRSDTVEMRTLLAGTAAEAGDVDLALETSQKLASDFPENAGYWTQAGELYEQKGQLDLAIGSLQKARQLAPNDPLISARLGNALGLAGRFPEAVAAYRQCLKLQPDNALFMNNLAWHLAWAETNLDEAATLVQRALQKVPENPDFKDTLGIVYLKSKKLDNALQVFQALARKVPDRPVFHTHLAIVLAELGRRQEAKDQLETALRKKPSATEAAEIRQLLGGLH